MKSTDYNPDIEEQIEQYLNGRLNQEEINLLWEKLVEYPYYAEYMKTCASLRHIGSEHNIIGRNDNVSRIEEDTSEYSHSFKYTIAACFALVLAVMSVLSILPEEAPPKPQALDMLELQASRTSAFSDNEFEREIYRGVSMAALGQEQEGLEILYHLLEEVDTEALKLDVITHIGIIHYNLADHETAKTAFLLVAQNPQAEPLVREKAWWYLANSYLKTNHREDALAAAKEVYDVNGAYRRMAARWLEGL